MNNKAIINIEFTSLQRLDAPSDSLLLSDRPTRPTRPRSMITFVDYWYYVEVVL